jgi:hypothetical protein
MEVSSTTIRSGPPEDRNSNPMDKFAKGAALSLVGGFVGLTLGGPIGGAIGAAAGAFANVAIGVSHRMESHAKGQPKD